MIEVQASSDSARAAIRQHLDFMLGQELWLDHADGCVVFTVTENAFSAESDVEDFAQFCLWNFASELTHEQALEIEAAINILQWNKR